MGNITESYKSATWAVKRAEKYVKENEVETFVLRDDSGVIKPFIVCDSPFILLGMWVDNPERTQIIWRCGPDGERDYVGYPASDAHLAGAFFELSDADQQLVWDEVSQRSTEGIGMIGVMRERHTKARTIRDFGLSVRREFANGIREQANVLEGEIAALRRKGQSMSRLINDEFDKVLVAYSEAYAADSDVYSLPFDAEARREANKKYLVSLRNVFALGNELGFTDFEMGDLCQVVISRIDKQKQEQEDVVA
jgi:hypothetical protein